MRSIKKHESYAQSVINQLREAATNYQSSRKRNAIYGFLYLLYDCYYRIRHSKCFKTCKAAISKALKVRRKKRPGS